MSVFNGQRLTNRAFKLDVERMRRGWYSDKYFANILRMLDGVRSNSGYQGQFARDIGRDLRGLNVGDLEVEMQFFTRRSGKTVVVGVDKALSMLRHCTGYFDEKDQWVETWSALQVTAVHDGATTDYQGDPLRVQPVIKVQGRYRDFALLETPMLGILSRGSRIATNVYNVLRAAKGKPVLFFPARFDIHEVQAADGYAYEIAVARFNQDYAGRLRPFVSTDAQGDWWGGGGGGTIAHAAIACFLSDTAAAMMAFARYVPADVPRIALVDFNNDSITDSLRTMQTMFTEYAALMAKGEAEEAQRYVLYGVRLDTSGSMRDECVPPLGDPALDLGVTPRLVFNVRQALDNAWQQWGLPVEQVEMAQTYCRNVHIVATGGFNPQKIARFEKLKVPADIYGVGSSLLLNDKETNTDFTADVVRVKIDGQWVDMAKIGRGAAPNPDLEPVNLANL
ncbi:MAG: nicotinate phosphoribosyltransferase [Anaerolineales bacterium]|nr:nicotinate phosphoribosyltransferase [Anaerolineales bacterium]MCB8991453.1 nicotinate phosphoribosyltransferase [Ardenticatenaceae bacterium]MCB9003927.1 nicotinate phosphoribosyltransferase [Ardenticatenaceae bacterium]